MTENLRMPLEYLPSKALGESERNFLSGLSGVILIPHSGAGLLPSIKALADLLTALDETLSRPGLRQYIDYLVRIHRCLTATDGLQSHLRAIPEKNQVAAQYWLLLMVAGGQGSVDTSPNAKQIVGAALLFYLMAAKPMPAYRAEQLQSFLGWPAMRWNHKKRWERLVQAVTLEPDVIIQVTSRGSTASTVDLGKWLADLVQEVARCSVPPITPYTRPASAIEKVDPEQASTPNYTEKFEDGNEVANGPLVLWAIKRSLKIWSPGWAGLNGWNWLSPQELKRVSANIMKAVESGDDLTLRLASFLVLSLLTGLPLKLLLRLPFVPNGDIWYDVAKGGVTWDLDVLVLRKAISEAILTSGHNPESIVHCPAPGWVAQVIRGIENDAQMLGDRLFPSLSLKEIRLRCWFLVEGATDNPRKPYFARFAYSLGAAILQATDDPISAAYASQDFRHLAPSEPHYLCFQKSRLFDALEKTYAWLELGSLEGGAPDGYVGSPLAPRTEIFRGAVKSIAAELQALNPLPRRGVLIDTAIEIFNRRSMLAAALFVLLTGERGSCFERRTVAALFGHPEVAIIFDKDTDSIAERPISLISTVRRLLEAYLGDVSFLAALAKREGHRRLAHRLGLLTELRRPNMPAFVICNRGKDETLRLAPIKAGNIEDVLRTYGMERNSGRHYWLSRLAEKGVAAYLRRTLSGHGTKAGQSFHSSAGLAPIDVLRELRPLLDAEATACALPSRWPSMGNLNSKPVLVAIRPPANDQIRDAAIDAYVRKDQRNSGRERRSFGLYSAAHYAHACLIRGALLRRNEALHPGAALLLSLIMVDGLCDASTCRTAWHALIGFQATTLLKTIFCELQLDSGRKRVFSPLPPTVLLLAEFQGAEQKLDCDEATKELVAWLRKVAPTVMWPDAEDKCLSALCSVALHLTLFEMPVWCATAEDKSLGAASISLSSLSRIAFRLPLATSDTPTKPLLRGSSKRRASNLDEVIKRVNKISSQEDRLGEQKKRKVSLRKMMATVRTCFTVHFPMVDAVIEYLIEECADQPIHGMPIVISTMAGYIGSLRIALEKRVMLHPLEFAEDDWFELKNELEKVAQESKREYDPSALRRFARFWRTQGAGVPSQIFAEEDNKPTDRPHWSTASAIIWSHEWSRICSAVLSGLAPGSVQDDVCRAYLTILWEAPNRANESNYLRFEDLDAAMNQIIVTSSGFAHLKVGEKTRRTIQIRAETIKQLSGLRARLKSLSPSRTYFFFDGDQPSRDPTFALMVGRVSRALREITGDPKARRHSLRGRAECELVVKDIEQFVAAQLNAKHQMASECMMPRTGTNSWRSIMYAASQAGHHSITAIATYLTIWPLVSRQIRMERLSEIWPGERFCGSSGIKWGKVRVWRHRAESTGKSSLVVWGRLMESIRLDILAPGVCLMGKVSDFSDDIVKLPGGQIAFSDQEEIARIIWCAGLLIVGASTQLATDISLARGVDRANQIAAKFNCNKEDTFKNGADLLRVIRDHGFSAARQFAAIADFGKLTQAFDALRETNRTLPAREEELVSVLTVLVLVVPSGWGIAVLPEYEGLPPNAIPRLRSLCTDLVIKPPSRVPGTRYRFTATAPGASRRSPRSQGAATIALSLLLAVAIELSTVSDPIQSQ